MKYSTEFVKQWADEIYNLAKQSTTCSYVIPYGRVDSFDPTDKDCQKDIYEYSWDDLYHDDNLQTIDFNDVNQLIIVMWYEPPKKEEPEEVEKMKKYTLKDYEEFCREALVIPPMEEFEDGTVDEDKWYEDHKIHIRIDNHEIEVGYFADTVNEIEFALKEMYEEEYGDGRPTTGNTVGSALRPAELKDILRIAIQNDWWTGCKDVSDFGEFIRKFIANIKDISDVMRYYEVIQRDYKDATDRCKCDFSKLDISTMRINPKTIRDAVDSLIGTDRELLYGVTDKNESSDIVFVMDYSLKFSGELIGWFYGEPDDEYIDELFADYKKKLFGEEK